MTSSAALVPFLAVLSLGALWYLTIGRSARRRRPTQHDLDPTLKKNQIRITTQKKAFRREDLPPEYLAQMDAAAAVANGRRDIVELPVGVARPALPRVDSTKDSPAMESSEWLPDHLKPAQSKGRRRNTKQK